MIRILLNMRCKSSENYTTTSCSNHPIGNSLDRSSNNNNYINNNIIKNKINDSICNNKINNNNINNNKTSNNNIIDICNIIITVK